MIKAKDYIDIVLPNYNSSRYLKQTINSVIMQTYKKWQLIIIDDCSDNKTLNLLKKFHKHKKIILIVLIVLFIELSGYGILASLSRLLSAL